MWWCVSVEPAGAGARVRVRELQQARAARAGRAHLPAVRRAAAQHRYVRTVCPPACVPGYSYVLYRDACSVRTRILTLRNESVVTAHWSTAVRKWPRMRNRKLASGLHTF